MYITYLYIRSILVFWCISFVCNNRGTALMHGINQILDLLTGIEPKTFVQLPKVESYCLVLFPRLLFSRHTINSQFEWDLVTAGHFVALTWLTANHSLASLLVCLGSLSCWTSKQVTCPRRHKRASYYLPSL